MITAGCRFLEIHFLMDDCFVRDTSVGWRLWLERHIDNGGVLGGAEQEQKSRTDQGENL